MLAQLPPALQNLQLPLRLKLWDGHQFDLGPQPSITITVKDPQLVAQFSHPTLDLLGSAFVEGKLELEGPISEVVRVCDELSQALLEDEGDHPAQRLSHDKETDAASISYHYDLSNSFYQLWLDRDMVYSCAYFERGDASLEEAQQAKFRHLCRKLRLQPGEYLLDVGCGWGGLARFAAREFGVKVFGITLSKEQLALARSGSPPKACRTRSTCSCSTIATCRRTAASTRWSASACSSTSATPTCSNTPISCSARCAREAW